MYTLITVLIIIASVFMVIFVLVQDSKGGGLASNFQSSNQVMGVRKTNNFLDKATWGLAIALFVLSIAGSAFLPKNTTNYSATELQEQIENAAPVVDPNAVPAFPSADDAVPANSEDESSATE